jgi:hypothetical protein
MKLFFIPPHITLHKTISQLFFTPSPSPSQLCFPASKYVANKLRPNGALYFFIPPISLGPRQHEWLDTDDDSDWDHHVQSWY